MSSEGIKRTARRLRRNILRAADIESAPQRKAFGYLEKLGSRLPDYRKEGVEPPQALKQAQFDDLKSQAGDLGSKYGDVKTMSVAGEDYIPKVYPKVPPRKRRSLKR